MCHGVSFWYCLIEYSLAILRPYAIRDIHDGPFRDNRHMAHVALQSYAHLDSVPASKLRWIVDMYTHLSPEGQQAIDSCLEALVHQAADRGLLPFQTVPAGLVKSSAQMLAGLALLLG
jgi:hypothetical protein